MCDTLVATADVTKDGVTIFAKNSDREPNEAQFMLSVPALDHPSGSTLTCTYLEIPQVSHTHAVLLSKPFWIWGAEIGVNEHGVAIGNEAVFSKMPANKKPALIGMDLLRLALERASNALDAVKTITGLLEKHGQGGNCGLYHKLFYHNSFIIADSHDAWLLETIDRHWAAKKIKGIGTISNGLTIEDQWDMASPDLVAYAVDQRWCKGRDDFNFRNCYSDVIFTRFSDCRHRSRRTHDLLDAVKGNIDIETVAGVLRDHGISKKGQRPPNNGITGASVCMHAGFGPVRGSQTTGSMISVLHPDHPVHFFTGTAAPCTAVFKPLWINVPLPDMGPEPKEIFNEASLFWQHERLHRETLRDYDTRIQLYREKRDALEQDFFQTSPKIASHRSEDREQYSRNCFNTAREMEAKWLEMITSCSPQKKGPMLYSRAWKKFDHQANMPSTV